MQSRVGTLRASHVIKVKTMKKILIAVLALLTALALFGCSNVEKPAGPTTAPTAESTAEPTAEPTPLPTEEPTAEPTPEPTAAPNPGEADLCIPLDTNGSTSADMDFDGRNDSFSFFTHEEEGLDVPSYELVVRTSAGAQYDVDFSVCDEIYAWIVDCDPTDCRAELIVTTRYLTEDWSTYGLRLSESEKEFKVFTAPFGVVKELEDSFTSESGLPVFDDTMILGARKLSAYAALGDEGFGLLSDGWSYTDNKSIKLKKDIEVQLVNEDGSLGDAVTVKSGKKLKPLTTDGNSWVTVLLPDDRIGYMTVEIHDYPEEWGIYLNGVNQDKIANLPYPRG